MMMISPTLILNGMNSLCRLCVRVPIYFNRMFNIIIFCTSANTILSAVFPGAVVRCSLCPLMYHTNVCYFKLLFVCLFPSFFRSFLVAEISSSLSFFFIICCKVSFSFLLHVLSFTGTGEPVNNWKGCVKHIR